MSNFNLNENVGSSNERFKRIASSERGVQFAGSL